MGRRVQLESLRLFLHYFWFQFPLAGIGKTSSLLHRVPLSLTHNWKAQTQAAAPLVRCPSKATRATQRYATWDETWGDRRRGRGPGGDPEHGPDPNPPWCHSALRVPSEFGSMAPDLSHTRSGTHLRGPWGCWARPAGAGQEVRRQPTLHPSIPPFLHPQVTMPSKKPAARSLLLAPPSFYRFYVVLNILPPARFRPSPKSSAL